MTTAKSEHQGAGDFLPLYFAVPELCQKDKSDNSDKRHQSPLLPAPPLWAIDAGSSALALRCPKTPLPRRNHPRTNDSAHRGAEYHPGPRRDRNAVRGGIGPISESRQREPRYGDPRNGIPRNGKNRPHTLRCQKTPGNLSTSPPRTASIARILSRWYFS